MEVELTKLVEVGLEQGIWAGLYIYLFFRMLRDNARREEEYQAIIESLSGGIQEGIEKIESRLEAMKRTE